MVERFFAEITRKRIRRGVFKSVAELESAIMTYLDNHNAAPKALRLDQDRQRNLPKGGQGETSVRSHNTSGRWRDGHNEATQHPGSSTALSAARFLPQRDSDLTSSREGEDGRRRSQTCSSRGTITLCAVPVISMQRHVEGRCGTEFGPLKVS